MTELSVVIFGLFFSECTHHTYTSRCPSKTFNPRASLVEVNCTTNDFKAVNNNIRSLKKQHKRTIYVFYRGMYM